MEWLTGEPFAKTCDWLPRAITADSTCEWCKIVELCFIAVTLLRSQDLVAGGVTLAITICSIWLFVDTKIVKTTSI